MGKELNTAAALAFLLGATVHSLTGDMSWTITEIQDVITVYKVELHVQRTNGYQRGTYWGWEEVRDILRFRYGKIELHGH